MIKTRQQALKEARKRWGKNALVKDNGWRSSVTKEERAAATEELRKVREQVRELRKRQSDLENIVWRYQYTVGNLSNVGPWGAFHVRGQGDTWDEAFAEVDRREAREREKYSQTG